jgi:hypothetical protein
LNEIQGSNRNPEECSSSAPATVYLIFMFVNMANQTWGQLQDRSQKVVMG